MVRCHSFSLTHVLAFYFIFFSSEMTLSHTLTLRYVSSIRTPMFLSHIHARARTHVHAIDISSLSLSLCLSFIRSRTHPTYIGIQETRRGRRSLYLEKWTRARVCVCELLLLLYLCRLYMCIIRIMCCARVYECSSGIMSIIVLEKKNYKCELRLNVWNAGYSPGKL